MASTDDDVFRKRLLIDGEGAGDDRKIQTLLKTFLKWFNDTEGSENDRNILYNKMLILLSQCDFNIGKTLQVHEMNQREMKNYRKRYEEIEKSIKVANEQISECKKELEEAKTIRKHRQEYDSLARVIAKEPNRKETTRQIESLDKEVQSMKETQETLVTKLELRKKQFHLLIHTIHELQEMLEDSSSTNTTKDMQIEGTSADVMDTS
ncbi:THO complex subunit 7 homolog isoform X2 [Dendronephthya gigantea]|uniref:THO complex subunit 7 homolog isoform X2 n=1 Tax=Dendronephthya gigantea TaxID=151771 RepID=UPI00106C3CE2|nr:THO complex subunit 7 homolog isoform X2 [Dendronephthya gigantea]